MKYKNIYDRKNLIDHETPTGSPFRMKRGWIHEDGELKFKETGKITNVYEEIQAYKEQVDIHSILERYENGDASALQKVQSMYIDTVDMPKNYAQLYDAVSKANIVFDTMPQEIKLKYNNNPATFWKNYGTETFDDIINTYRSEKLANYGMVDNDPVKTVVESEVKDEQKSE